MSELGEREKERRVGGEGGDGQAEMCGKRREAVLVLEYVQRDGWRAVGADGRPVGFRVLRRAAPR